MVPGGAGPAAIAGTIALGAATFAAAALLIISAAAPTPDGLRVARGGADGGPPAAPTACGGIRAVDGGPASPHARA